MLKIDTNIILYSIKAYCDLHYAIEVINVFVKYKEIIVFSCISQERMFCIKGNRYSFRKNAFPLYY